MMKFITKTIYLQFIACAKNAWLQMNKPELKDMFALSDFDRSLVAKGNLVESWAQKLFPRGVLISEFGETARAATVERLAKKEPVIFQASFTSGRFLARNDVLEYDSRNDVWNLYEIKGTNTLDENENSPDHIEDVAFQVAVLEDNGLKLGKIYIIHLNKEYVREDDISVDELFIKEDVSREVRERLEATRIKMGSAAEILWEKDEKAVACLCLYSARSNHCSTFSYSHPEIPEYSVHDLSRIGASKSKLTELVDAKIYELGEIPDSFKLTAVQRNQVFVHKTQKPLIDSSAIGKEIGSLSYPLYFLDYETYPSAIPLFKGFRPYQQVPFQFSLHVLKDPQAEPEHFEYLHAENTDPSEKIIANLKKYIVPRGHVIVWNKRFEKGINAQLAERHPEAASFLNDLNERIYDLMEIFQKQLYVHPGFRGRVSIKKVLPVLVPSLSYQDLEIKEGGAAMEAWHDMVFGDKTRTEKQAAIRNLLKYCGLDTYAMYLIWRELAKLAAY